MTAMLQNPLWCCLLLDLVAFLFWWSFLLGENGSENLIKSFYFSMFFFCLYFKAIFVCSKNFNDLQLFLHTLMDV